MKVINKLKTLCGLNLLGRMKKEQKYFAPGSYKGTINLKKVIFKFLKCKETNKYYFSASCECSNPSRCDGQLILFSSKKYNEKMKANFDMALSAIEAHREFKSTQFFLPNYNDKYGCVTSWDTYIDGKFVEVSTCVAFNPSCLYCQTPLSENYNHNTCPCCGEFLNQ